MAAQADIAVVGLAVMGENLVLNMESKGFTVAVYNRTTSKVDDFVGKDGRGYGKKVIGCKSPEELVASLKAPRKIMLMVRAGSAVDATIKPLIPLLSKGDVIIDGGNSHFPDSNRRCKELEAQGILFVGSGVSGGEEGALLGPSIMPGGSSAAWPLIKPIFQGISAKTSDGEPCCEWVGEEGSGHYVKMVHNGIEYGDMQLIAEAYHLLKNLLGLTNDELAEVFTEWNKGDLDSYLIEITASIFKKKDEDGQTYVLDKILDTAGQKGTGKWTAISALDFGVPVTLIGEAVFARCLSAHKEQRVEASSSLSYEPTEKIDPSQRAQIINDVRDALYASKLVSYAQGFMLLQTAAKDYGWKLNFGGIALMWRGGCIIRSQFLGKITEAFNNNANLSNLLLDPFFKEKVLTAQKGWRSTCARAITQGIPIPAMSTAMSFFDGFRTKNLPANLIQAQRDFFGAHTYERTDKNRGEFFHTNWTGSGGSTSSTTYNV
eukprot:TRINITY_DN1303_c0_g1_i1.p1 TRINITY_DN1303_c0_g1~~TRINITY_DN1303_c0_g1_i1.p1  ORF type:complete len:502 (+),score=243.88 TRINITY_DN1303_c0_g1_i1:37-1506(+)